IGTSYVAPTFDPTCTQLTPAVIGTGLLGELSNRDSSTGNPCDPNTWNLTGRPRFGNSGRSILDGPGFQNWDIGLLKDFSLGEKLRMQFRAEFFNAFNQAHFNDPRRNITSSTVGKIFGAHEPRNIQFGVKFIW
ncbi:MAG: hypothetical protein DMG23_15335, partial [Acidobacteria bacterium]